MICTKKKRNHKKQNLNCKIKKQFNKQRKKCTDLED